MAKQTVNIGTSANDRTGDSLRTAFNKINENFNELYVALGLGDTTLNLGAFTFTGSVMDTDDSSNITINKPITVNGEIVVDGDITPATNFGANLGTPSKRFNDLYLSGNTIYLGNTSIGVNANGDFLLNGQDLASATATFDQTLNTADAVSFAEVSVGNLRVAPIGNGVELLNTTDDIIITAQDDFTVSTTTGDINLNTNAGSVGLDAAGGLLQMQGENGVDISSALGDIELNAFNNNVVFKSPVVGLVGDITGSVFADDSTLLVDGVNGKLVGEVAYTPDVDIFWLIQPTTVKEAIERLAEAVYVLKGGEI